MNLRAILAVALGGGIGSVLRYVIAVIVTPRVGSEFPWATLLINIAGSFAIGLISELTQFRTGAPSIVRLFLMVGILGGFTTFSAFSLEMVTLASERALGSVLLYGFGSVMLGFAFAYAGIVAGKGLQP